jgi:transposase-like protein
MIKIKCPKCGTESSMSLAQPTYEGPYRCWKCKENFSIKIVGNKLESCEPLSQEEFERRQQLDALKAKLGKPPQD